MSLLQVLFIAAVIAVVIVFIAEVLIETVWYWNKLDNGSKIVNIAVILVILYMIVMICIL